MTTKSLTWYEDKGDAYFIWAKNHWNFQLAMLVKANGNSSANVVWQSRGSGPQFKLSWTTRYALSYVIDFQDGVKVEISGDWQECLPGESWKVGEDGFWTTGDLKATKGWFGAETDYVYPGVDGIHIVLGVPNSAGDGWDPIYVDPVTLNQGSSGEYYPQEQMVWWLEGSDLSGQVHSRTKSRSTQHDFSKVTSRGDYDYFTTYSKAGNWGFGETKGMKMSNIKRPAALKANAPVELHPSPALALPVTGLPAPFLRTLLDNLRQELDKTDAGKWASVYTDESVTTVFISADSPDGFVGQTTVKGAIEPGAAQDAQLAPLESVSKTVLAKFMSEQLKGTAAPGNFSFVRTQANALTAADAAKEAAEESDPSTTNSGGDAGGNAGGV